VLSSSRACGRCSKSRSVSPCNPEAQIPQRLIDVPLESLPHIDEHSVYVAASADRVWEALIASVARPGRIHVLALMGQHRFSRYALIFYAADTAAGPVRLEAETRAEFPGLRGQIYKTLVIRSRAHAVATRSVLRKVQRRAERG
jgi:hypothetical protein